MFRFVICDDEIMFTKKVVSVIDSFFMKNNFEYTTTVFKEYDNELEKIIKDKDTNKIYILDIELKNGISGIDIARKIRLYDWNSTIIMLTSHGEMGYDVLKAQIMVFDFISKFDNYKEQLELDINKIIYQVNNHSIIHYENKGTTYRINIHNILYIVKEPLDRRCKVVTVNGQYYINCTLNEISRKLNDNFFFSHRSCIVNIEYIEHVDWKNGIIMFSKGQKIDLLSRKNKKELKNYVNV